MPLIVKQFNCPKCGSPLSIKNAARSKSVVCPACSSQIDLAGPEYQVVANVGPRPAPKLRQFQVGMKGTLAGEQHEIIGRVLYRDDEGYTWDEWLLLSAAGDYRWLSDDEEEGMVLWHAYTPSQPVDPNTVRDGQTINLSGVPARVAEVGQAVIAYLEGELTWKARVGETMRALDAQGPGGEMLSIEWTSDEVEFYRGQRQNSAEVASAFGLSSAVAAQVGGAGAAGKRAAPLAAVIVVAIIAIALCICVGAAFGAGGGSSNCAATPAAVRSSDCTSFGSGGGGFGGGGGGGK